MLVVTRGTGAVHWAPSPQCSPSGAVVEESVWASRVLQLSWVRAVAPPTPGWDTASWVTCHGSLESKVRGACCAVRYPDRIVPRIDAKSVVAAPSSGSPGAGLLQHHSFVNRLTSAPAAGGCEGWVLRVARRENASVSPGTPARSLGDTCTVSFYLVDAVFLLLPYFHQLRDDYFVSPGLLA